MFVLNWLFIIVVRAVLIVLGLVLVPIGIAFSDWGVSVSDGRPILVFPKWLWIWGNDFDGNLGDKRGWWNEHGPFGLPATSFLSQYVWLALRNPANNFRRTSLGSCPVTECEIFWRGHYHVEDRPGGSGWQLVFAENAEGKRWYGFYLVNEYGNGRALVVRVGFKILPRHDDVPGEPPKGFTVRFNPWKKL